ncbi:MAG: argininosuccinate lyase [Deltaproteobacteria bacterium CG_4_9_14_3_um_filter_51_14]|nr:MAG: argininosuccinate lyase [Deltaproteobacteria bacterium CG_4_9_14_3_um_filter_51_14]
MGDKLWGGRFRMKTDLLVNSFNSSIGFDKRLYAQDIAGSIAHCRMLGRCGIISENESVSIIEALGEIKRRMDRRELVPDDDYEDIHSFVEKMLVENVGPAGEKLHTGRSRNDQVALDVRLYVRDAVARIAGLIKEAMKALVIMAEKHIDTIMPGYTHLQRAQPIVLAHHLMAYYEMLKRDRKRFQESLSRINVLPLGSAALAGSTFKLDRDMVAEELGFAGISANSMDAVSDRDFVLEYLFDASLLMMHLSRLSEEIILWNSQEFRFVSISDSFCTGSSIMPQKKNPDVPELIRGKTGRVYGNLMGLLTVMKGLPLAYNKDLQEDKEVLFDTVDTVEMCLEVMKALLGELTFDIERLRNSCSKGFLTATDLAEYLVGRGVTFRQAHEITGRIVLYASDCGKELHELSMEEMKGFSRQIGQDIYPWLTPEGSVSRRTLKGGTAPDTVKEGIARAKEELGLD